MSKKISDEFGRDLLKLLAKYITKDATPLDILENTAAAAVATVTTIAPIINRSEKEVFDIYKAFLVVKFNDAINKEPFETKKEKHLN